MANTIDYLPMPAEEVEMTELNSILEPMDSSDYQFQFIDYYPEEKHSPITMDSFYEKFEKSIQQPNKNRLMNYFYTSAAPFMTANSIPSMTSSKLPPSTSSPLKSSSSAASSLNSFDDEEITKENFHFLVDGKKLTNALRLGTEERPFNLPIITRRHPPVFVQHSSNLPQYFIDELFYRVHENIQHQSKDYFDDDVNDVYGNYFGPRSSTNEKNKKPKSSPMSLKLLANSSDTSKHSSKIKTGNNKKNNKTSNARQSTSTLSSSMFKNWWQEQRKRKLMFAL